MFGKGLRIGGLVLSMTMAAHFEAVPANDTRLADAVMRHDENAVRVLLRERVDVNAPQADGMTALHWAVRADDVETVSLLLRAGAKVNAATRYGVTPIYLACANGSESMVDTLLRAGADANAVNPGGETALMTAARIGKIGAVKALIDRGATIDSREKVRGQTALMWAVIENHVDVAWLLLRSGANVNAQTDVNIPDGMETS